MYVICKTPDLYFFIFCCGATLKFILCFCSYQIKVTVHTNVVLFRSFHLLCSIFCCALICMRCMNSFAWFLCMRSKVYEWGCQVYSVTLPLYQVLQSCECQVSRLIVHGVWECVLYMEIPWKCINIADRSFAKGGVVADLNRTCCEF